MAEEIDCANRDPNEVNQHLKIAFADVFAEPHESIFSFDGVWKCSYKCFFNVKLWCYRIITLFCAVPAAFCWACEFACLAFYHIWCVMPCLRAVQIPFGVMKELLITMLDACISPCCLACGNIFGNINVKMDK